MQKPKLILIIGSGRNVGKTLLGEHIVRLAAARGLRVWVIKHVHHGVDYRVKDTGRYLSAGASRVYAVAPGEYMLVEKREITLDSIIVEASGKADLVVVEGFRSLASSLQADLVVCIGLSRPECGVTLAPGFNPHEAARSILEKLYTAEHERD